MTAYQVRAVRAPAPLKIDGELDEDVWMTAEPAANFIQRDPDDGKLSTERTEVRFLYDRDNLYVGFWCYDSDPKGIVANERRRDGYIWDNDLVVMIIDTYRDRRNGFYFATTPVGARFDAYIGDEGLLYNENWDGIWDVKTKITLDGWTAEFEIPFSTLRFDPNAEIWGINFGRKIRRKNEDAYWRPLSRDLGMGGFFKVSYAGELLGMRGLKQATSFQVLPSVIGGVEWSTTAGETHLDHTSHLDLNLKYSLTSSMTMDGALDPDFAQVESDAEVVNLTRFDLFFPEKRPFFIEGSEVFRTPINVFYSRRVGLTSDRVQIPILLGAKLTGRAGGYNLGLIDVLTKEKTYTDDAGRTQRVPATNFSVVRIRRDILARSSVGLTYVGKDDDLHFDRTLGADFNAVLLRTMRFDGMLANNRRRGMEGSWAGSLSTLWQNDLLNYSLSYTSIGRRFNPEAGFILRNDIREGTGSFGVTPRPSIDGVRQMYFTYSLDYLTNQSNLLQTRLNQLAWQTLFQNSTYIDFSYVNEYESLDYDWEISRGIVVPANEYRLERFNLEVMTDKKRFLSADISADIGGFYGGTKQSVGVAPQLLVSSSLKLEVDFRHDRVALPAGKFTTDVVNSKVTWSLSPELYVRTIVQWNSDRDLFNVNALLRYTYRPGSDLYLVVNTAHATDNLLSDGRSSAVTVLAKLSFYLGI